jgi:hypothetical protein
MRHAQTDDKITVTGKNGGNGKEGDKCQRSHFIELYRRVVYTKDGVRRSAFAYLERPSICSPNS